jgi:hypothetical protein
MLDPLPSRRFDRSLLEAGPHQGQVVAVFAHTAIVRFDDDGTLLTLLHPSRDLVPFGIAIPWDVSPSAGAAVRLDERQLFVGESRAVQLEGDGTALRLEKAPFSFEALKTQMPVLQRQAKRERSRLEKRALSKADEALRRVVTSMSTGLYATEDLQRATRRLVGAGFGSTPTGDDWLVGLAAAGYRFADSGFLFRPAWQTFLAALDEVPAKATTPVAHAMLKHAVQGDLPEALLRFAALLGNPTAAVHDLRDACARLLEVGSQTGGDFMTGALSLANGVRGQHGGMA